MRIYTNSIKIHIGTRILQVCFTILMSMSFSNAQNYVAFGSEMAIFNSLDLTTSTSWSTDRSATPGYFAWTNGNFTYTGADDIHNINGYVKKYGVDAFVFPVGTGTDLRTLSISAPNAVTDVYGVAWIVGSPSTTGDPTNANAMHSITSVSGTIKSVSSLGQWDWVAISGTGAGLIVTISIPTTSGMGTASDLRLVGWNGTNWVSLGTAGASGLTENSTLSGTMIAGIQAIGIGTIFTNIITLAPAPTQTDIVSTPQSGNAATELTPTGGTGPYSYSSGVSDAGCVAPSGATTLPASSNFTINSTGTYTYTAPATPGKYYYCIKVCDSSTPTANCSVAVYTDIVTAAPCLAGNSAPVPR